MSPFSNKERAIMERVKNNNKSKSLFLFLIMFFIVISMLGGGTVTANAQAVEQSSSPTAQEIVDNTVFVTFRKGNTAERGHYIVACFYIPYEYYDTANTYGVVIFPKDYGIRYGLTSDYHKKSEENGAAILDVVATTGINEENGYGINCGVINIYEGNLSRTMCFIFYAKDTNGNIAYAEPEFADWESLTVGEMTMEELLQKTDMAMDMESSFRKIVQKIQELVDSIWIYVVIAMSSVVVVWALYIGIKVIIAQKNEEKINARGMLKGLLIGVIVMFVVAVGAPLLINGMSHWVTW